MRFPTGIIMTGETGLMLSHLITGLKFQILVDW